MSLEEKMSDYDITTSAFHVARLAGTGREMGRSLGRWLKSEKPGFFEFFTRGGFHPESKGFGGWGELKAICERACPGILEEIEGFAEAVGVDDERLAFWDWTALPAGNCSHAAVAPKESATGTALVMRSYEWKPEEDDLTLCVTRRQGAFAHIGCSAGVFGRMDGMNERGFSVTMSGGMAAGLPAEWRYRKGLIFWVVIRGMLDNCADVAAGLAFLRENVPTGNHCFILADRSGRAALAEMSGGELAVREMEDDPFLVSVNHFVVPPLDRKNKLDFILEGSVPRRAFIEKILRSALPRIGVPDLKKLLAGEAPNGCFGPWYAQGFGTLWASIFDLGKGEAEYCFGAPGFGTWKTFGFDGTAGFERHEAVFARK
jgi:predicted choloylglycine hydrolase